MPDSLLRVLACGSVDDGKSTLIGRLLFECGTIPDDLMMTLERDSRRFGTVEGGLDYALLVDGLAAEREQGVTIDVAYRYFETARRRFILADAPGHHQYTRNMVTGASTADLAVILIDARRGVLTQTKRHSYLVSLIGIKNVVLAINKMDLIDYDQDKFDAIVADYRSCADSIGITHFLAMPISALAGDNISSRSAKMDWYRGPSLIEHLETVVVDVDVEQTQPLRMPARASMPLVIRLASNCRTRPRSASISGSVGSRSRRISAAGSCSRYSSATSVTS